MLVLGVIAADVEVGDVHGVVVTHDCFGRLPDAVRRRLHCSVVERLTPLVQRHDIEGLMMGG